MTKQTFRHVVDGRTFKRQSARAYTHVVVARPNIERQLAASAATRETPEQIAKDAAYEWAHRQSIIDAGVGGVVFYHRCQGGAYLNPSGPRCVVTEGTLGIAREYHHASVEAEIAHNTAEQDRRLSQDAARIVGQDPAWRVISWHHSAALAAKAADSAAGRMDVRVEAINGGVTP